MQVLTNTTKNWVKTPIVLWTIIATLFMMTGFYVAFQANTASAAALTVVSDTVTTSAPSTTAGHTFTFTTATALTTGSTPDAVDLNIFLQFPRATGADPFTINAIVPGDVTVSCTSCGGAGFSDVEAVTLGNLDSGDDGQNDNIKIEVDEDTLQGTAGIPIGSVFTVVIDNAPGIDNPGKVAAAGTADPWSIDIETRDGSTNNTEDTGSASIAVIEGVTVSATIDESLSFTISGVANTTCDTIVTGGTSNTTTPTTVPYQEGSTGSILTETFYNGCLQLEVGTNSANGYTTTIEQDGLLTSASLDTIAEGTCDPDGTPCSDTVIQNWDTSTNNGFAYCMRDSQNDGAETADAGWTTAAQCGGGSQGFKTFPTTPTTEDIMSSAGALATNDITRTAFRISAPSSQEAGTYENVVEFVTTPVF